MGEGGDTPRPHARKAAAAAVRLAEVGANFPLADGDNYFAVDRTSLVVADGEFVSIVGPTGCGKSTLLNIAAGLLAPSARRVRGFGATPAGPQPPARHPLQARPLFPLPTPP